MRIHFICTGFLFLSLCSCDSQEPFEPARVALFSPDTATDSLVIGAPFRLHVRIEHSGDIEKLHVVLSYALEDPDAAYIDLTIDNVPISNEMVVDTVLIVPNDAQPSELVGRPCELDITAFVPGVRSGIRVTFPLISVPTENIPQR